MTRKIHHVAWDEACERKDEEGLGLRLARKQNIAFTMKLGWGVVKCQDTLWVKFLREKYKCGNDVLPIIEGEKEHLRPRKASPSPGKIRARVLGGA